MEQFLVKFVRLYAHKMNEDILETRCLDEWADVYEVDRFGATFEVTTRDRLRVFLKSSFRTNVRRIVGSAARGCCGSGGAKGAK